MEAKLAYYEGMNEGEPCTLMDDQKRRAKDWFMSNKWRINFKTNDGSFNDFADITIVDNNYRTVNSENIRMNAVDEVGKSTLEGILMYKSDYFGLYFFKNYNNKQEAGQTGSFEWLVYDGVQQGETFRGKWYYEGYENTPQYAGIW